MADLTDKEITEACARALKIPARSFKATDAQTTKLLTLLRIDVRHTNQKIATAWYQCHRTGMALQADAAHHNSVNMAVRECAARVQIEKEKNANG